MARREEKRRMYWDGTTVKDAYPPGAVPVDVTLSYDVPEDYVVTAVLRFGQDVAGDTADRVQGGIRSTLEGCFGAKHVESVEVKKVPR